MTSLFRMRTTLNLDDDVFHLVKAYAEHRSLATGKAVSELVRRGLSAPVKTKTVNGLMIFDVPDSSETVTSEQVKRLAAEER
jgi:hypothetical protein